VLSREELKKLERKAKSLMLTKEIPQGKVDIVRSILTNGKLLEEERYKAIIELLLNLPDKKSEPLKSPKRVGIETPSLVKKNATAVSSTNPYAGPTQSSVYVDDLYHKHKSKGLFKKRWLINASNKFGIGIRKRLIPSKKLLKLSREIASFQEKLASRLPIIITMVIDDLNINDPTIFNYLRIIQKWVMDTPFASYDSAQVKWMDQRHFEQQMKSFCTMYYAFRELDTGMKESIILSVETKLREMEDLKKEIIHQIEPDSSRSEKEKRNLHREKIVYEYMMTLRSFLPSLDSSEGILCQFLKNKYDISSLDEYCLIVMESLVFQRDIKAPEIIRYYGIKAPIVSSSIWDYSEEYIKRIGKDPESQNKRITEKLESLFSILEERYQFINIRYGTIDFIQKAFEEQWKIINKRRQDLGDIYEKDFFTFLDESLDYFIKGYLPFLDGSTLSIAETVNNRIDTFIFTKSYFENEISMFSNLLADLIRLKTDNPNLTISREEAKRIVLGQIPSMANIERFYRQLSSCFYEIGKKLQSALDSHREWMKIQTPNASPSKFPAEPGSFENREPRPFPFHTFKLISKDDSHPAYKYLAGRLIVTDTLTDGVYNTITAFCFQFSDECFDRNLISDMEYRKELKKKLQNSEKL
jgi:hypothetical protein